MPWPVRRLLELAESWDDAALAELPQAANCKTARPLRPADVDNLVDAYRAGATVRELAERYGVHRVTIGRNLQARGVSTRQPALSASDVPRAARLYESGWSLAKIAE